MNDNNDYIYNYMDNCISYNNYTNYDISKVIYELIKNKFKYCGKNIWKYYSNNSIYNFIIINDITNIIDDIINVIFDIINNINNYPNYDIIFDIINDCIIIINNTINIINNNINIMIVDYKEEQLKKEIKSNVKNFFILRSIYWNNKAITANDNNIIIEYLNKSELLLRIANKLNNIYHLKNIIKELKQFFNNNIDE